MGSFSKKRRADSDASEDEVPVQAAKKSKSAADGAAPDGKDDEGNAYWELSNKRRVGVSKFKNMCFINVREYYEKDGKMLPGKKGISLSIEQYTAFLKAAPGINAALSDMGYVVDEDGDVEDAPAPPVKAKKEKESKASKANIEATSDEDED